MISEGPQKLHGGVGGLRHAHRLVGALLFLTLLASRAAAATVYCDVSSLPALQTNIFTACEVSALTDLRTSTFFTSPADPAFCVAECTKAVSTLDDIISVCTAATVDAALGAGVSSLIESVALQQTACNPPSATCLRIYHDLVRWQLTAEGQTCAATISAIANATVNTQTQVQTQQFCQGRCGGGFAFYMSAMENAGCNTWQAYRQWKVQFSTACYSVKAGGQVTYCASVFNVDRFSEDIIVAASSSATSAARVAALDRFCSLPCFYEYLRNISTYVDNLASLRQLELLCLRDSAASSSLSGYCNPLVGSLTNPSADLPSQSLVLCQPSVGLCTPKVYSRLAILSSSASTAAMYNTHVQYMCVRSPARSLCADLTQSVTTGMYFNGSFLGTSFYGPSACSAIGTNSYCTWGCQRRFTPIRDGFDCCFNSTWTYYKRLQLSASNAPFTQANIVANECARPMANGCNLTAAAGTITTTVTLPVPYSYAAQTWPTLKGLVAADLAAALGRPVSTLNITALSSSGGNTIITVDIAHQQLVDAQAVVSSFSADVANSRVVFFNTQQAYGSRCTTCSAAWALVPSLGLFAVLLFLVMGV